MLRTAGQPSTVAVAENPEWRRLGAWGMRFCRAALATVVAILAMQATARAAELIIDHVDIVDVVQRRVVRDGQIVISGENIVYSGPRRALPPGVPVRDGRGLVALPGFVNAHTHLWQHAARGLKTSSDLQRWSDIVHQFLHYSTREEMYAATRAAAGQALLSGFTSTADFASAYSEFTLDATSSAMRDAGLDGVVVWWNPAAFLPPEVKRQEMRRLARRIRPLELWVSQGHAFLFDLPVRYEGVRLAAELGLGLTEHTLETIGGIRGTYARDSAYLKRYGARLAPKVRADLKALLAVGPPSRIDRVHWMRRLARQILADPASVARLTPAERTRLEHWRALPASFSVAKMLDFLGAFDLARPYVSIHSVWVDDEDIALFARKNVFVAYNPESNLRLSSGIAPVWEMVRRRVGVALGTDGAASNDGIDAFSAMRAAWNLQKIEMLDATVTGKAIDAWTILRMATLGGAEVLGIADKTGSLTAGKQADIVLLSKRALSLAPIFASKSNDTLVAMTIYSADARSIDTVISNGRVVVEGGKLKDGLTEAQLSARLNAVANAVMVRQAQGKAWSRTYDLGTVDGGLPWYRYRSVRKADSVSITLTNSGGRPRSILIAFSGVPEGGASAPMLSAATLARFPLDPPKLYWSRRVTLASGGRIAIGKRAGGFAYTILLPAGAVQRTGTAEQLLILVDR